MIYLDDDQEEEKATELKQGCRFPVYTDTVLCAYAHFGVQVLPIQFDSINLTPARKYS
jgi:hypothetical protein